MVMLPDPIKLLLLWPKLFNAVLSITIAFKIKKLSKYILNLLFFLAFVSWGVFIAADGILYVIAPFNAASFAFANVLRDLGEIMIGFTPLCFVLAFFVIKEGEEIALVKKRRRLLTVFLLSFALAIITILVDGVAVFDAATGNQIPPVALPPTSDFKVKFISSPTWLGYALYFVFIAWYFIAVVNIFNLQKRATGIEKKRNLFIMWGMLLIPLGMLYFVFIPLLMTPPPFLLVLGQVIWTLSPVLVFLGFRMSEE